MNHTDSLEVWASLHKNAGNHLHSQEDPSSKKEKKIQYLNWKPQSFFSAT